MSYSQSSQEMLRVIVEIPSKILQMGIAQDPPLIRFVMLMAPNTTVGQLLSESVDHYNQFYTMFPRINTQSYFLRHNTAGADLIDPTQLLSDVLTNLNFHSWKPEVSIIPKSVFSKQSQHQVQHFNSIDQSPSSNKAINTTKHSNSSTQSGLPAQKNQKFDGTPGQNKKQPKPTAVRTTSESSNTGETPAKIQLNSKQPKPSAAPKVTAHPVITSSKAKQTASIATPSKPAATTNDNAQAKARMGVDIIPPSGEPKKVAAPPVATESSGSSASSVSTSASSSPSSSTASSPSGSERIKATQSSSTVVPKPVVNPPKLTQPSMDEDQEENYKSNTIKRGREQMAKAVTHSQSSSSTTKVSAAATTKSKSPISSRSSSSDDSDDDVEPPTKKAKIVEQEAASSQSKPASRPAHSTTKHTNAHDIPSQSAPTYATTTHSSSQPVAARSSKMDIDHTSEVPDSTINSNSTNTATNNVSHSESEDTGSRRSNRISAKAPGKKATAAAAVLVPIEEEEDSKSGRSLSDISSMADTEFDSGDDASSAIDKLSEHSKKTKSISASQDKSTPAKRASSKPKEPDVGKFTISSKTAFKSSGAKASGKKSA